MPVETPGEETGGQDRTQPSRYRRKVQPPFNHVRFSAGCTNHVRHVSQSGIVELGFGTKRSRLLTLEGRRFPWSTGA